MFSVNCCVYTSQKTEQIVRLLSFCLCNFVSDDCGWKVVFLLGRKIQNCFSSQPLIFLVSISLVITDSKWLSAFSLAYLRYCAVLVRPTHCNIPVIKYFIVIILTFSQGEQCQEKYFLKHLFRPYFIATSDYVKLI